MSRIVPPLALAMLIMASCDSVGGDDPPPLDTSVLVPLAVGNYWEYAVTWLTDVPTDTFRFEITRAIEVDLEGEHATVFARSTLYGCAAYEEEHAWLFTNSADGLYRAGGVAETDTLVLRILDRKYPAQVGDQWPAVRMEYRQYTTQEFAVADTSQVTLVATGEELYTPAGRFTCHVYKYSYRPAYDVVEWWDNLEYYARGAGLVRHLILGQTEGRTIWDAMLIRRRAV